MTKRLAQANVTRKAVLKRLLSIEDAIVRARAYLRTGEHANWAGFRPLFVPKLRANGDLAPPHKEWIRNVYIPRMEKDLVRTEKILERIT